MAMELHTLVQLTTGVALLTCVLAVAGVHAYASGRARRAALVDRLAHTGAPPPTGRRRRFSGLDRRLRRTRLGRRLERRLAATGMDVTPGEFFAAMLAAVAALWLVGQATLAPFFGPLAGLLGVGAAVHSSTGSGRSASNAFINQLPNWPASWPTPPRPASPCAPRSAWPREELEAPAGEELAKVSDQLSVGHSPGGRPR